MQISTNQLFYFPSFSLPFLYHRSFALLYCSFDRLYGRHSSWMNLLPISGSLSMQTPFCSWLVLILEVFVVLTIYRMCLDFTWHFAINLGWYSLLLVNRQPQTPIVVRQVRHGSVLLAPPHSWTVGLSQTDSVIVFDKFWFGPKKKHW